MPIIASGTWVAQVTNSIQGTSDQPFRLLDLPLDIRNVLFSHLLPSVPVIDCSLQNSPCQDIPRNCWPQSCIMGTPDYSFARYEYNLGDYKDGYLPQILRVSRQLRQEGTAYLYHRKTFIITVYHTGFDFLKGSGQLQTLPNLPFYEMKEFVIRIPPHTLRTHGTRLRGSLVWLCGLLHQSGARFKKLRIDFTDQLSEWDPWPKEVPLWEYTDDSPESIPTELLLNDEEEWYTNFEYLAWREGCYSTWEWLVSPLAMLSGVADKCIIDIPRSYQGNKHYEDVKVWYEQGVEGQYPFDEEHRILQLDRWWFRHLSRTAREDWEDGSDECFAKSRLRADERDVIERRAAGERERDETLEVGWDRILSW